MRYFTLCEALSGGAFEGVNCQHGGGGGGVEFTISFCKGQTPGGLPGWGGGGRIGALGID